MPLILTLLLLLPGALAAAPETAGGFVGGASCEGCHAEETAAWRGSHHDLAMQTPTPESVLGDFSGSEFTHQGVTSKFYRRDGQYFVRTDGEDGSLQEFPVRYVFGVYPLQQYLLPLSRGRLQALSVAWDSRPEDQGGQRWFHLYPDEEIDHADPLHWTGPYQNWNTRCAECHSTDLQKRYAADNRSFATTYAEIDVSCEACHGPGQKHVALAESGKLADAVAGGFSLDLAQRGEWHFPAGAAIAERRETLDGDTQIDSCGRCHARRGTLGDYVHGRPLTDTHRLALPREPLYHPDGQILDEVYVYGSFVQSKMHQAGVVCSNCHEPHSLQLRADNNGVCAQCHQGQTYDTPEHHHHAAGSPGAMCANCHMPETTYMVVDPRRDHSMRVPRPDLSVMLDTPNACTDCHQDRGDEWALQALRDWGVRFSDAGTHPARAFAAATRGDLRAQPRLAELAANPEAAPIWRAAAVEALAQGADRRALETARDLLQSPDPLLRTSAVNSLEWLPIAQRYGLLQGLISDDITSVRLAVAESLASVPLEQVSEAQAEALRQLFREYTDIARQHADMPGSQMQLGLFLAARGDLPAAEKAYREALYLNRELVPARVNLADLLRRQQRPDEAREQLQLALAIAPEHGLSLHALGLLETRAGNAELALDYLARAAAVEESGIRHRYVYAIALHDLGQPGAALDQLRRLHRIAPANADVLLALANYSAEQGEREAALGYARQLVQLQPQNPGFQRMLRQLQAGR